MKHKHIQYLKFIFCSEDIDIEFLLEGAGVAGIPWILPGGSVDLLQVKGLNLSLNQNVYQISLTPSQDR